MIRASIAVTATLLCIGCDEIPQEGSDTQAESGADVNTNVSSVYVTGEAGGLSPTLNDFSYNAETDTLTINNLPFDDPENQYVRVLSEQFNGTFDLYESDPNLAAGENPYYAVFKRTDNTQVVAAGSDAYIGAGFGGAGAQRITSVSFPSAGIYTYTGEYAAVRTVTPDNGNTVLTLVTGNANLSLDMDDLDIGPTAIGTISGRREYNQAGLQIGTIDGFISLATAQFDTSTGLVTDGTASEFDGNDENIGTGTWQAVAAGQNVQEIAGIVFVSGTPNATLGGGNASTVTETGGFITNR